MLIKVSWNPIGGKIPSTMTYYIFTSIWGGITTYVARSTNTSSIGGIQSGYYNPNTGIAYISYASSVHQLTDNYELLTQYICKYFLNIKSENID